MICNDFATHFSIFIVLYLFYLRNRKQQKRQISKLIDCINQKKVHRKAKSRHKVTAFILVGLAGLEPTTSRV